MYLGHRRFLPTNHQCRKKGKHFKGEADHRKKRAMHTGDHVLAMVNDLHIIFGKGPDGLAVPNARHLQVLHTFNSMTSLELRSSRVSRESSVSTMAW